MNSNIDEQLLRKILASPDKTVRVWSYYYPSSWGAEDAATKKSRQLFEHFRNELLGSSTSKVSKTLYESLPLTDYFNRGCDQIPPADLTVMVFDIDNAPVPAFSIAKLIRPAITSFKMVDIILPNNESKTISLPSLQVNNIDIWSIINAALFDLSLLGDANAFNDFMNNKYKEFLRILHWFILAALYMMSCRSTNNVQNHPYLLLFSGDLRRYIDYIRKTLVEFQSMVLPRGTKDDDTQKFKNMLTFIIMVMDAFVGSSQQQTQQIKINQASLSDDQKKEIKQLAKHAAHTTNTLFGQILRKAGNQYTEFLRKMSEQQQLDNALKPFFNYLQQHKKEAPWVRLMKGFLSLLMNQYAGFCADPKQFQLDKTQFNKWKKLVIRHSNTIIDIILEKIKPYSLLKKDGELPSDKMRLVVHKLRQDLAPLSDKDVISWSNMLNFQVAVCAAHGVCRIIIPTKQRTSSEQATASQRASIVAAAKQPAQRTTKTGSPQSVNQQVEYPCPLFTKTNQQSQIVQKTMKKLHPRLVWWNKLMDVIMFWKKDRRVQRNVQQFLQSKSKLQNAQRDPSISLYYNPQNEEKVRATIRQLYKNDFEKMLDLIDRLSNSIPNLKTLEPVLTISRSGIISLLRSKATQDQKILYDSVEESYQELIFYLGQCFRGELMTLNESPIRKLSTQLSKLAANAKNCTTTKRSKSDKMVVAMVDGIVSQIEDLIEQNCSKVGYAKNMAEKWVGGRVIDSKQRSSIMAA